MPLILESYDSLPYIDTEISAAAREKADRELRRELKSVDTAAQHPLLPAQRQPQFSELVTKELERLAAGQPREGGIDLSRYQELDEPSEDNDAAAWREALRAAYTSSTLLKGRHTNLTLLEELGKNAWLMGNSQLDQILKALDQELSATKEEVDSVNRERKSAQEASKGELDALEDTWKKGIGRLIEVQLAADQLRTDLRGR
ncbi:uncharacterized protein AB675_4369 [Cyphellophora attinorum]|uniref:Pre-mRNA-splicing factor SPF27 n=1 Tax=Cyphellophora attinorum TaxID=1664694 RepID=A0A0N0NJF3_9EURO|nr:uncharacterized protein AB675_4369 [Phialophora attinorum]KPI36559.1 hypothetical protein AB675_4369 [Phialophora attinorum]